MTPIARWMEFNSDSTQTSGNGWLQHSVGTWNVTDRNELSIVKSNGLLDTAASFKITLDKNKMTWSRLEEGENVQVFLERIYKIPASDGNQLMGLWKLDTIILDNHFEKNDSKTTLYLRWDNTYVRQDYLDKKYYGIYKVHSHKPELQMVNYGENPKFEFYSFSINEGKLILTKKDSKFNKEKFIYSRIYQFPK